MSLIGIVACASVVNSLHPPLNNAFEHRGTVRYHHVLLLVLTKVSPAVHEGIVNRLLETLGFLSKPVRVEQVLQAA